YNLPTSVRGPQDIVPGPDGALWFTANGRIGRITTAGTVTSYALPSGSGNRGQDITVGPDKNIWFAETFGNRIGKVNIATKAVIAANISGTVFNDLNHDRLRTSNEPGLGNVRVYIDTNGNNKFDSTERFTLTNSAGNWTLIVPAGHNIVRHVSPTGFALTTPTSGEFDLTLTAGQSLIGKLFGDTKIL